MYTHTHTHTHTPLCVCVCVCVIMSAINVLIINNYEVHITKYDDIGDGNVAIHSDLNMFCGQSL
jgi:hypothetical protein